ncbi:MAG: DUF5320 domain-containing protein [Candidatus Aureabacteria bacterium]|nr:DUF5320 domain-containing protein [Candidatus Auribacterota bacterium]
MPGFDGTGPLGRGPMTGGGRGLCVLPEGTFRGNAGIRYFGRGFGYGRGFGRGRGRGGMGRRFAFGRIGWDSYPYDPYDGLSYPANITPGQEADMLRAEAKTMQEEMNAINKRLKDIESAQKQKTDK